MGKYLVKSKMMVLGGEGRSFGEIRCFGCELDKSGPDGAECFRKVVSRREAAAEFRWLENARSLQSE